MESGSCVVHASCEDLLTVATVLRRTSRFERSSAIGAGAVKPAAHRIAPRLLVTAATTTVIYNADEIVASGGDTAISPDNIDVNGRHLMIQEDGTTQSRAVMADKRRDGSIWRFNLEPGYARERIAELDPPGRGGVAVGPGVWETSGIINARRLFGRDTWLFDVQAHPPTPEPIPGTVEDGQLLLMRPAD